MPGFNPFDVTTKRVLKKLGGDKISSKVILDESLSSEPIDNFGGTFYANENADGTEIEVGKTYIVTTDSGSFTAVCKELADGFLYLGNAKPLGAEDTGESYCCFLMYEDGWAFGASDFNNGTHIKIKTSETIVPIDQKYLPGVKEINLADYGIDLLAVANSGRDQVIFEAPGLRDAIGDGTNVIFVNPSENLTLMARPTLIMRGDGFVRFQISLDFADDNSKTVTKIVFILGFGDAFADTLIIDLFT